LAKSESGSRASNRIGGKLGERERERNAEELFILPFPISFSAFWAGTHLAAFDTICLFLLFLPGATVSAPGLGKTMFSFGLTAKALEDVFSFFY
jgi:hypothetical protein